MTWTQSMPGCCTARVIGGFEHGQEWDRTSELKLIEDRIYNEVLRILTQVKKNGDAVVFATTTDRQVNANKALADLGFYSCENPVQKKNHPTTVVYPWFMTLNEFNPSDFTEREIPKNTSIFRY